MRRPYLRFPAVISAFYGQRSITSDAAVPKLGYFAGHHGASAHVFHNIAAANLKQCVKTETDP